MTHFLAPTGAVDDAQEALAVDEVDPEH